MDKFRSDQEVEGLLGRGKFMGEKMGYKVRLLKKSREELIIWKCDKCDLKFKNETTLTKHSMAFHGRKRRYEKNKPEVVTCRLCLLEFSNSQELLHHLETSEHLAKDFLPGCFQEIQKTEDITKKVKFYKCLLCKENDDELTSDITTHLWERHQIRTPIPILYQAVDLDSNEPTSLQRPSQQPKPNVSKFVCNLCNKACGSENLLNLHVQRQHLNQLPQCKFCREPCISWDALNMHFVSHLESFAHKTKLQFCRVCGMPSDKRSFIRQHEYEEHYLTKQRQRISCAFCNYQFNSLVELYRHEQKYHKALIPLLEYPMSITKNLTINDN